jgi:hypothetical protein
MSIIIKLCRERECVCNLFKSLSINVDTNPQSIGNCPLNVMYLWNDTGLLTQKARIPTRYLGSIVGALKCGNISAADLHWLRNRNHTTTTTADNTHNFGKTPTPNIKKIRWNQLTTNSSELADMFLCSQLWGASSRDGELIRVSQGISSEIS